jgi:flagellar M-ring protein FliF
VLDAGKSGVNTTEISQLVGNAVGLDTTRGDSVQVSSVAFDTTAAKTAAKQLADAQAAERNATFLDLGKKAAIGLALLVVLAVAWRRRRTAITDTRVSAVASDLPAEGTVLAGALPDGRMAALGAAPEVDEDTRLRRERMRHELTAFVDSQPDEIAQLVQGWLAERKS